VVLLDTDQDQRKLMVAEPHRGCTGR
jgi:hypothetical protein